MFWLLLNVALALQIPMTPQQRFDKSGLVVSAEVTSTETRWSDDALGGIETSIWLAPIETLSGQEPEVLEVVLAGGEIDGIRVEVEDTPHLALDRTYLLFLVQDDLGRWIVLGGEAGAVRVDTPGGSPGPSLHSVLDGLGLQP